MKAEQPPANAPDWHTFRNWHHVLPPNRPGEWLVNEIQSNIATIDRSKPVAILGSTPEYRSLLHRMEFKDVYVCDYSLSFYRASGRFLTHRGNETVLQGDWLETLPLYRSVFSCILSDLTLGNIAYEKRGQFCDNVLGALREDGVLIDRVLRHQSLRPLHELILSFRERPFNLDTLNAFNSSVLFNSSLISSGLVNPGRIVDHLTSELDIYPWLAPYLNHLHLISPMDATWYYGKLWSEVRQSYFPCATVKDLQQEPDDSPYANTAAVLLVRR